MKDKSLQDAKDNDAVSTSKTVQTVDIQDIDNGILEHRNPSIVTRLLAKIRLEQTTDNLSESCWSNVDLEPVSLERQTWNGWNFVVYWLCDAIAPGNLRLGSSIVTLGLSWQTAIGIIALGHFLISLLIAANGVIGARLHIPYTVQARASFGFHASFLVVGVRFLVGLFWYGINTYNGALCIRAVLIAIWPSFGDLPNGLPESANITTQTTTAYVLYFLLTMPFHYIHPRKLTWFFNLKAALCLPAIFAMLGWACHEGAGGGLRTTLLLRGNTISGSKYSWAFLSALNSMLGNYGTMAVNINDFARYSRKTRSVFAQIIVIPLSFSMMAYVGVIIAGAATDLYGEEIWDPLTVLSHWRGSSGARAAAAFCGLAFALAQLGSNISANCISAANDLNAMFPRYVNLRRGSYIVAFVGAWALTPWNILASASALLNFMDGYTIWLAPITGILLADYYLISHRIYNVEELYRPDGLYRFNKLGTNWPGMIAWTFSWIPLLPGFAHAVNASNAISLGAMHLYSLGYMFGFFLSAVVYIGLSWTWPSRICAKRGRDPDRQHGSSV